MKERPILFNGAMVRAILDGRKTQTRRVVKPQPPDSHSFHGFVSFSTRTADEGKALWARGESPCLVDAKRVRCPYGQPGDRLWVRESWQGCRQDFDGGLLPIYAATDSRTEAGWRPSIHMPRWASRITLEVTGARVERLQDISEADARAEGLRVDLSRGLPAYSARQEFERLWESINGPESWTANPWVWVVEFKSVLPAAQQGEGD